MTTKAKTARAKTTKAKTTKAKTKTETQARRSVATVLVDLAEAAGVTLFHTLAGEPHAAIPTDDTHIEVWPIRSGGFRVWLRRLYHQVCRGTLGGQALDDALGTLEGHALFDGETEEVHVRLAEAHGTIYLDLGDRYWRVVEITASGWDVLAQSPVRFVRPKGVEGLPEPECGGTVDALREFLTVDDDGWRLVIGWLVAALRPGRPFPILALFGEPGAAKSTQARMLRRLVDPNEADLRPCPREEYDLAVAAKNGWMVAFDNVSEIKPWLSDALCRVATGIGFGRRKLYTDAEEYILAVKRPIILNGIEEVATRGDFVDRAILQGLPPITRRRDEDELWAAYTAVRPAVLSGLLNVIVGALRDLPGVRLDQPPRMADFARWVVAAEPTLGWGPGAFLASYRRNRVRATGATLEASLIVDPLRALLGQDAAFEGSVTELLRLLRERVDERVLRDPDWPKDATRFSGELRRLAPALRRQEGIDVTFPRTGKRRVVIHKTKEGEQREQRETPGADGHASHAAHAASPRPSYDTATEGDGVSDNGAPGAACGAVRCLKREPGEDDDDDSPAWTGSSDEGLRGEGDQGQTPPSTPEQPRDEPVVAALLALAAQHHWGALEYGPGHVVGGSEAAWRRFAVHGLVEDRYAALERLKALPGAEPGSRLPGSRNGGIA